MKLRFSFVILSFLIVGCSHSVKMMKTPQHSNAFSPSSISVKEKMPLIMGDFVDVQIESADVFDLLGKRI